MPDLYSRSIVQDKTISEQEDKKGNLFKQDIDIIDINIQLCNLSVYNRIRHNYNSSIPTNHSTIIVQFYQILTLLHSKNDQLFNISFIYKNVQSNLTYFLWCLFIFGLHPIFSKLIKGRIFPEIATLIKLDEEPWWQWMLFVQCWTMWWITDVPVQLLLPTATLWTADADWMWLCQYWWQEWLQLD